MPCCSVPLCNNGYAKEEKIRKENGGEKPSFFRVKQRDVPSWNRAVPRADRPLTTKSYVCSDHFYERDIIRFHEDLVIDGHVIKGDPRPPKLREGAIPSIFKGPKYLNIPDKPKRKAPAVREAPPSKQNKVEEVPIEDPIQIQEPDPDIPSPFIDPDNVTLPDQSWAVHRTDHSHHYVKVDAVCHITHAVSIDKNKNMTFKIGRRQVQLKEIKLEGTPTEAANAGDIEAAIRQLGKLAPCEGNGFGGFSNKCPGAVPQGHRCNFCKGSRKSELRKKKRQSESKKVMQKKAATYKRKMLYRLKKQNTTLRKTVKSVKQELKESYKKCRMLERSQVENAIKDLPANQQLAVLTCLDAAKRKGPKGNRFRLEWIYEAMLMRIKSPKLYEHVRTNRILVLPCRTTLNRYMRKLHPRYGFQKTLFAVLKEKLSDMDPKARHGNFVIDEIKIEAGVNFDRHTLQHVGLVNLVDAEGESITEKDKNQVGDHVLEIIFQPFQGNWYQTLGCFLTKGNAQGDVLAKLIVEGVALCENAGLYVDGVVTDGATWNRNMWEKFGIDEKTFSCEHPCTPTRKMWFFSDWCHLLKCARNGLCPLVPTKKKQVPINKSTPQDNGNCGEENEEDIDGDLLEDSSHQALGPATEKKGKRKTRLETEQEFQERRSIALNKQIETPDGMVKRKHWLALEEAESRMAGRYGIGAMTYVPNFSKKHIFPTGFERMNVKLAQQFFSNSVASGMEFYRKKGHPDLDDSQATEAFIRKFNDLADSMNSGSPAGAYRLGSKHEKIIDDYIEYHKECVAIAKQKGQKAFFSEPTDLGLLVTLNSTRELCHYLIKEVGYDYVMTRRFNQDVIEQFFSNIRSALGPNPHPSAKQYAQVHRLLSVYSLVKPPQGSNVTGAENVKSLITAEDLVAESEKQRKEEINAILDELVTQGEAGEDSLPPVYRIDHSYGRRAPVMEDPLVKFMAGFTACRQKKLVDNCDNCLLTFSQFRDEAGPSYDFTKIKEMYGGYTYPSNELANLISAAEKGVQDCIYNEQVSEDMFINTLKYIKLQPDHYVGCLDHMQEVSKKVIKFYVTARMFFVEDKINKQHEAQKKLKKMYAKQSKLVS